MDSEIGTESDIITRDTNNDVKNNDNNQGSKKDNTDKWGYLVCFGTIITFIAGIGHVNSFGLIYKDFIIDTHSTAKSLTAAHGVYAIMLAVGGIILNIIIKKYSIRQGGFVGVLLMLTGSVSTIFISNTNQLPFTFGVLQGIGFGMMVPVCYTTINFYFIRRRTMVLSVCKAVQGIILMWYPQLLKIILSVYGFRGTLLIISGISLHTIPGMLVMNIKKHPKRPIRVTETSKNVLICWLINLMTETVILEILHLKALSDPVYCNICFGQSFVNFSDLTFFIFQPMLLFQFGYDTSQVATCISICAGADVAGRCALAFFSSITSVNTRGLYYVATFFTFVFRLAILELREFYHVAAVTAVLGTLRGLLHVSSPLVISDYVRHEDFPGAYALFMLSAGLVNVSVSPFIGLLKDVYHDYVPAFYALTVCCLPCLIFWPVEYFIKLEK